MNEPIRRSVRLPCPIGLAFEIFTSRLDAWWPPGHRRFEASVMRLDAQIGGRFFERSSVGEEAELGRVLVCQPPHRILYTWRPGSIAQPTQVDVRFVDEGDTTLIEVTHAEGAAALGDAWPDRAILFGKSWATVLDALVAYAADPDDPPQQGRFP